MAIDIERIVERLKGSGRYAALERIPAAQGVPPEEREALWDAIGRMVCPAYRRDGDNAWLYSQLRAWAEGGPFSCMDPATRAEVPGDPALGIYVAGRTGTGKSVALDILREYLRAIGACVDVAGRRTPLAWAAWRADQVCAQYAEHGSVERFKKEPVLCVQDLGSEQQETVYMGNRAQVMRSVLEYRGDYRELVTVLSSNLSYSKVEEFYGVRVASRLRGMCNYFVLGGPDRRARRAE